MGKSSAGMRKSNREKCPFGRRILLRNMGARMSILVKMVPGIARILVSMSRFFIIGVLLEKTTYSNAVE
jgi:hypothetical protein